MLERFLEVNWILQIIISIFVLNLTYFIIYLFARAVFRSYFDAKKSFIRCMFVASIKEDQEVQPKVTSDKAGENVRLEITK